MKKLLLFFFLVFIQQSYGQSVLPGMPAPNSNVWAILRIGNTVYIGGTFSSVGGSPRFGVASFDATTGALTNWNPNINGPVYSIAAAGGKLIVGGEFDSVNFQPKRGICMFDLATGTLDSWEALPYTALTVLSIEVFNNNFYFGGFTTSGSGYQRIYCVDAT